MVMFGDAFAKILHIFDKKEGFDRDYKLGRVLGESAYSVVRVAEHKADKSQCAIKVVNTKAMGNEDAELLTREINILKRVSHEKIVQMKTVFYTADQIYIVMELMSGGDLFTRIEKKSAFREPDAARCMFQIFEAITYCHSKNIVHRDIKPENFLFATEADDSVLKLTDFALAIEINQHELLYQSCGTLGYLSPEAIFAEQVGYSFEVDIWAAGVIFYILLCGFAPFYDEDDEVMFRMIEECDSASLPFPDPFWSNISESAKEFIRKLLMHNPADRPSASDCMKHPWITKLMNGEDEKLLSPRINVDAQGVPNELNSGHEVSDDAAVHKKIAAYNARKRLRGTIRAVQLGIAAQRNRKSDSSINSQGNSQVICETVSLHSPMSVETPGTVAILPQSVGGLPDAGSPAVNENLECSAAVTDSISNSLKNDSVTENLIDAKSIENACMLPSVEISHPINENSSTS